MLVNALSFGLVAALASAANAEHVYGHAQYLKRHDFYGNQTTSVTSSMATSTLCSTTTEIITHCPKYVKDCPAESTETRTRTVPTGMSSYPVVTTSSSSSSTYMSAPTKTTKKATRSSSTVVDDTQTSSEETTTTTKTSTITKYTTVTMTTGHGADKTVITSTLPVTDTKSRTHTVYATRPSAKEEEPTTTHTSTSTTTRTVTVYPKPSGSDVNVEPTGAHGGDKCEPSTVTKTEKETIFVTVTPSASETSKTYASPSETSKSPVMPPKHSQSHYYPNPSNTSKTTSAGTEMPYLSSTATAEPTMSGYSPRYPPSYGKRR